MHLKVEKAPIILALGATLMASLGKRLFQKK